MEDVNVAANDRAAGFTLASAALVSVLAMAHHPTGASAHGGLSQLVHGVMMLVVLAFLSGFTRYTWGRGLDRFWVQAALGAYAMGAVANLLAASINGFAAPALVARDVSGDVLQVCWELNQVFAYGAVYASSIAFALWGYDALAGRPKAGWVLGVAGLVAGLVPAALLASGTLSMNVSGAIVIYAAQAAFGLVVGVHLLLARS